MGCSLSVKDPGSGPPGGAEDGGEDEVAQVSLSAEERQVIRRSWTQMQEDISRVGVIMFLRLFETHPECKDVFLMFRDLDDPEALKASRDLRAHGLRIMSVIEKIVARIDQDERVDQLILDLGRKHYHYKALPKYFTFVGAEFIRAVQPVLRERWSPDLEEAWKTLFLYISSTMRRGFRQEEEEERL
ncbi:neuroglobin-like [Lates calcarifer]|uniref:Neuroglobin-like n=1 Tax=Lates calcarifer TaxID=8187 RepID=A0A4W6EKU8_LATCA|nr:neuroglobin-like [Lates calcarifer]